MNEAKGLSTELELTVEMSATGRIIVPDDITRRGFVSGGGQVYEDDAWRIRLYVTKSEPSVYVTYRGKNLQGTNRLSRHYAFGTGRLTLRLDIQDDDIAHAVIAATIQTYDDILKDDFGILHGHIYDSPNQIWDNGDDGEYTNLVVVSDGVVECHYGDGKCSTNPTVEELAAVVAADKVCYKVSGATWSVVCLWDGDSPAEIMLYTEAGRLVNMLDDLNQYLERHELSGFDDLLQL